MTETHDAAALLAEAVSAFDAANHAWGRFWLYRYRPYSGLPPAPDASAVRAAFQEATLAVPPTPDAAALADFLLAVRALRSALPPFLAALPPTLAAGDILTVTDALAEADSLIAAAALAALNHDPQGAPSHGGGDHGLR